MARLHTETALGVERVMEVCAEALRAELQASHKRCSCASSAACFTHALDRVGAVTVARRSSPDGQWFVRGDESQQFQVAVEDPTWDNLFTVQVLL